MEHYVYCWTNTTNGYRYVGKGKGRRAWDHLPAAICGRTSCRVFYEAIRAHGPEVFQLGFIATGLDNATSLSVERAFIAMYRTKVDGYNLTDGGEGEGGNVHTAESKRRMSKPKVYTDATRAHLSSIRRGRQLPAAQRAKVSQALSGKPKAPEHAARVGAVSRAKAAPRLEAAAQAFTGVALQRHARSCGVDYEALKPYVLRLGWYVEGKGSAARWLRHPG